MLDPQISLGWPTVRWCFRGNYPDARKNRLQPVQKYLSQPCTDDARFPHRAILPADSHCGSGLSGLFPVGLIQWEWKQSCSSIDPALGLTQLPESKAEIIARKLQAFSKLWPVYSHLKYLS